MITGIGNLHVIYKWCPIPDMLGMKYYEVIMSIAKEEERAKQYIGTAKSSGYYSIWQGLL